MRVTICDVCDAKFETDAEMIQMIIPGEFLGNVDGVTMTADVCSWPCVNTIVDGALNSFPEEEEKAQGEEEEKPQAFIAVPKTPTIDTSMDEKTLARFTEQVTGVKRR